MVGGGKSWVYAWCITAALMSKSVALLAEEEKTVACPPIECPAMPTPSEKSTYWKGSEQPPTSPLHSLAHEIMLSCFL